MKRGVSAFLFLAVFICTSSSAQASENLLENEFFEEWENGEPTDWKTQFVPVQSEESLVGNYSLMSEGAYYQYAYQEVEVEEGETYYLEAWWQVLTGKGDITLRYRNEAEEDYDLDEDRLTPEDGWKSLEGNHTAKSSGNITIRLGHHRNGDEDSKILSGAAWLGTDEPPKDWLLKNESENDTAENVSEYVLNIDATEGGNTEPSEGEHFYEENETVSVEAAPDDGWEFVEWEGDVDTDNKTLELTMDGNKSVTALFEESDTEENGTANSIEIVELPEAVGFGETFNIGLDVTRNKTQAHTVYINVRRPEDNWRVTEEVVTKVGDRTEGRNMNYSLFVPVSLDPNCDGNFSTGEYEVVAEGLGEEDRKYLEISDLEDSCEKKVEKEVVERETETVYREREFELIGHDKEVEQGAKINTEVLIRNPGNNTENFTVYSYAYDGKTPLTKGGWTGNERSIELKAEEKEILRLKNTVKDSAPVGVHDFKVRIEDEEDLESEVEIREKKNTTAEEDKEQNQTEEETVAEDKDNETEGTKETKTSATGDIYRRRGPLESIIQSLINLF